MNKVDTTRYQFTHQLAPQVVLMSLCIQQHLFQDDMN